MFVPSGGWFWTVSWGSTDGDSGTAVDVNLADEVYVTGSYRGTCDFDPGSGSEQRTSNGNADVFVSAFDLWGDFQWVRTWGGSLFQEGWGVEADRFGNIYVTSRHNDPIESAPIDAPCFAASHILTSAGDADMTLSKFLPDGCW